MDAASSPHGSIHHKDDCVKRLQRIEGQVRGLPSAQSYV